jgi:HD superfamily phosphohydrolase
MTTKHQHEIRDPIHGFIRVDSQERKIIDSYPFQRLRHIHQLAMTYLIYPGATHRRFEHSLGVMELAGRIFDIVTKAENLSTEAARSVVPASDLSYWRRVVRMAALCHDIGHLPFSHAAEKELLPKGWTHERISDELIRSEGMAELWREIKVQPDDVAKLALGPKEFGPKKHRTVNFSPWEEILAEIIVGDAFGADRMDYLLRDSFHAGVAYGRFDHFRLIDTLRILPKPGGEASTLGIEEGGLHSVEALLLARYFMYTQVYFHHIRRIYDYHLKEFLKAWLPAGRFSTKLAKHLAMTDNEVSSAILAAANSPRAPGHDHARRIVKREHYRLLYSRNPEDVGAVNLSAAERIAAAATEKFGDAAVHFFPYKEKNRRLEFPVGLHDGRVVSCLLASDVLNQIPGVSVEFVFIAPEQRSTAETWLAKERARIVAPMEGESE